jgi:acyl-CoA thioester hydrolase
MSKILSETIELSVRFSEVDSMGVVWHGNYLKFFEEGREAFGHKYNIGYHDVLREKLLVPVVHSEIDYKRSLRYGDKMLVEARFEDTPAAKVIFHYRITRIGDGALIATGNTVQVFTNEQGELQLLIPDFFRRWKEKWF